MRRADVAGVNQLLSGFERVGGAVLDLPYEAFDKALDLALGQGADEAVDRTAALKGDDGGDRLDAELSGDLRLIIDVHLDESSLAARAGDHTLDYRAQLLAGLAPGSPEINQHDLAHGGFENIVPEALDRRFHRSGPPLIRQNHHPAPSEANQFACLINVR